MSSMMLALLIVWGGIVIGGFIGLFLILRDAPEPETPSYEVRIEERFRELEIRIKSAEGEAVLAKRLALGGTQENGPASVYAHMAASYFATMATLGAGNITAEAAAAIVTETVSADPQLAEIWELVINNLATPRLFEDLLWGKLLVLLSRSLAPALDG